MNAKPDGTERDPRSSPSARTDTASAAQQADEIDRQLRLMYEAILAEPVPQRLITLISRSPGSSRRDH